MKNGNKRDTIMIPHLLLEYGITMTVLPIRIRLRFYDKNAVAPSWSFPVGKQSRSLCGSKWGYAFWVCSSIWDYTFFILRRKTQ